jgi:hypothetical protein
LTYDVIPGRCDSIEPGISRFPDAQLRICGLVLEPVIGPRFARTRWHHPGMTAERRML